MTCWCGVFSALGWKMLQLCVHLQNVESFFCPPWCCALECTFFRGLHHNHSPHVLLPRMKWSPSISNDFKGRVSHNPCCVTTDADSLVIVLQFDFMCGVSTMHMHYYWVFHFAFDFAGLLVCGGSAS